MVLKYLFKISPPTAKLDINKVVKLGFWDYWWSCCEGLRSEREMD